jgi:hypothetical protein
MENYEFNEASGALGGRRFKKDTTKRTLNNAIFNGAYLTDRINRLFTGGEISNERLMVGKTYELYKDKGWIGLNIETFRQREKIMKTPMAEIISKSYTISHDPRNNGNNLEFEYNIRSKVFGFSIRVLIDMESKRFLIDKGEFYSECFPTPLDDEGEVMDDRNTLFEESGKSTVSFSPDLLNLITTSSGGGRVSNFINEQIHYDVSELITKYLVRMFAKQITECDVIESKFSRKKKPFSKLNEGISRMLELIKILG